MAVENFINGFSLPGCTFSFWSCLLSKLKVKTEEEDWESLLSF